MSKKISNLLLRSLDTTLTPQEQHRLNQALSRSGALRHELEQLKVMRQSIHQSGKRTFRPFFAERVMQRIETSAQQKPAEDTFFFALKKVFRPVAIAAVIFIVVILSYQAVRHDGVVFAGVVDHSDVTLDEAFDLRIEWIQE
jgi:anti-sigma factor RsiW